MEPLTGRELVSLTAALLSAFPNEGDLKMVVNLLDERYAHIVSGATYKDRTHALVVWADAHNRVLPLVVEARAENSGNPKLKAFHDAYLRSRPRAGTPAAELPLVPEALPFVDQDQRLPIGWFRAALTAADAIVRITVPRHFDGRPDGKMGLGTGWLITPTLVMTNHHVIEARELRFERRASDRDFEDQAHHAKLELGCFDEASGGGAGPTALVTADRELDYAILRLVDGPPGPSPLRLSRQREAPTVGARVNILQHAGGRPLRFAVRTNYVVAIPPEDRARPILRYLTETEGGASGSPVLDDDWQVVALHHAHLEVSPRARKGQPDALGHPTPSMARYHNQGMLMTAIVDHLPAAIREEIARAQGWPAG